MGYLAGTSERLAHVMGYLAGTSERPAHAMGYLAANFAETRAIQYNNG
jgi:hypothetical protein